MSDNKYVVPDGMFKSATDSWGLESDAMRKCTKIILEAALRWQSENPIVPTDRQWYECVNESQKLGYPSNELYAHAAAEWQRRMYLAPEPEVPTYEELISKWEEENRSGVPNRVVMKESQEASFDPPLERAKKTEANRSCSACEQGQSSERGEGTHLEGTVQHPVDPKVPEKIKDLLSKFDAGGKYDRRGLVTELEEIRDEHNADILEAYRRVKKDGKK